MADNIESRWRRYGRDRVYVKRPDGSPIGYVDLDKGTIVPDQPDDVRVLVDCLERWRNSRSISPDPPVQQPQPRIVPPAVDRDLALNRPGSAAAAKQQELRAAAPVRTVIDRIFDRKTDERAWRLGADGERQVGNDLARLGSRWRVLHAVPVGTRGSDIDHVVIGPGGVFTLNSKRHPRARVWVGEHQIRVNGQPTHYVRNSIHEAQRASRLLSTAVGRDIDVVPVLVFTGLNELSIKQQPLDVHVSNRPRLVKWLKKRRPILSAEMVDRIYDAARRECTWTRTVSRG